MCHILPAIDSLVQHIYHLKHHPSVCGLDMHPSQDGVLRAVWKVTAEKESMATGIRVRVGSIVAESIIEVFAKESDKFKHVNGLMFARKQYRVIADNRNKSVALMAPLSLVLKG